MQKKTREMINISNKAGDITTESTDIKRIIKEYDKIFYTNKLKMK